MKHCTFSAQAQKKKNPPRESFLHFRKRKPPKKFLIFSQKKTFVVFQQTKTLNVFFTFQETELFYISRNGIFRTLAHLELEAYSEP